MYLLSPLFSASLFLLLPFYIVQYSIELDNETIIFRYFLNLFVVHQSLYKSIFIAYFCELFHGSLILIIVNVLKNYNQMFNLI